MDKSTGVDTLLEKLFQDNTTVSVSGISGAAEAYLTTQIAVRARRPVVVVVADSREAERVLDDIAFFLGPDHRAPALFPSYTVLPFKPVAYHNKTAAARIELLYRMAQSATPPVLVLTIEGLRQRLIPKEVLCDYAEIIMAGETLETEALRHKLTAGGYVHSAIVEEPGDFSIRGGILDIFSSLYEEPLRAELFGDMVETLSFFSPVTQRRTKAISEAVILPARETVLEQKNTGRLIASVKKQAALLDLPLSETRRVIDLISTGAEFSGLDGLMPLMYDRLSTFFDYLPAEACLAFFSQQSLEGVIAAHHQQLQNNFEAVREAGTMCVSPETMYLDWSEVQACSSRFSVLTTQITAGQSDDALNKAVVISPAISTRALDDLKIRLSTSTEKENLLSPLAAFIEANRDSKVTSVIVCGSDSQVERLVHLLRPYRIEPIPADHVAAVRPGTGSVYTIVGQLSSGFEDAAAGLSFVCDHEIFGKPPRRRKISRREVQTRLLELEDLKQGDLVVHVDYGIGQYQGIVNISIEGLSNDFILITYKDDDRLYLSVDRMDMVRKYIGVEGIEPVLDKMGGAAWERARNKARKEAEKIAKDLLKLYARRKVTPGHAFDPPEDYLREFEAGFPYDETEDQLQVVVEVLSDMALPTPMDRLVCGDVGFGKTEIAMRAAFVAVCDGRQVAVLTPTTVLAEQHLATFSRRFADYPVNIACLNRFRSPAEQKRIVADMKDGKVDIVIGTHRLLSADVGFSELGLVILDEEQRFGVKHKEVFRKLRHSVDVLSLTATPIPRTLHMSLMGVRDISLINTPPVNRVAIKTYVSEFDDGVVTAAVRRELERGGQIYFVHNNINKIWAIANRLQALVPEVRLGVAHGRLNRNDLEKIMRKFVNREIDMLVCTRIVESGLDIPSANTIFVNRADRFGLAQVYQLRGRVGRSGEQAYAYLFIPRESALGRDARKRLKVLMEHSDLGSGFRIAMSDLQIRGGGSALGVSQSGHIAAVGYDMFLELMDRTVAELKGEPVETPLQPEINVPLSVNIAEDYIPSIDQRLSVYRRLSRAKTVGDITAVRDELIDRYGRIPEATENLLLKIMLKVLAIRAGVKKLDLTETELCLQFSSIHMGESSGFVKIAEDYDGSWEKMEAGSANPRLRLRFDPRTGRGPVIMAKRILKEIIGHVKNTTHSEHGQAMNP